MKLIKWTEKELESINQYGETCYATAEAAMKRTGINFDQIERINNRYEVHTWGSNADRKYRKSAVRKAIMTVASNPMKYAL